MVMVEVKQDGMWWGVYKDGVKIVSCKDEKEAQRYADLLSPQACPRV